MRWIKIIFYRNVVAFTNVDLWKGVIAEMVCTSILIIVGCGSCIGKDWASNTPTNVQISFTFGFAVATMVRCIGHVSGGHINPAVTVSMLVTRRITVIRGFLYILAQLAGALIGSGILKAVTPVRFEGDLGLTTVSADLKAFPDAVIVEGLITFVLVFTVFASCDANRNDIGGSIPLSIGLCVVFCHMFAIKYTGSSLNPARTFGPAVVTGIWTYHWVYWAGPISGAIVAAWMYEFVISSNASINKLKHFFTDVDYTGDHLYDVAPLKDPSRPSEGVEEFKASELERNDSDKEEYRIS